MNFLEKQIWHLSKAIDPTFRTASGMRYINWYPKKESWIEHFILNRFPDRKCYDDINIVGVYGKRWRINLYGGRKIFFSGENLAPCTERATLINNGKVVTHKNIEKYGDYLLKDVDLSLAFKSDENATNYLRWPLWIWYLVGYDSTYNDIKNIVSDINSKYSKAEKDSVLVCSHDHWGMRTMICDALKNEMDITYAGKWRNNTDELWTKFNNNKIEYLNNFKFNICPENMDAEDYCTEKLFEALLGGCIPIYAGCNNNPEPGIINENFIIKWNMDGDNSENIKLIRRLKNDDIFYRKWMKQDKLHPYAAEYIYDRMQKLEDKLRDIL